MAEPRDFHKERIVSIDFDGVLSKYDGWKGEDILGDPFPGAKEFVLRLIETGYTPVVFTTRKAVRVKPWLSEFGFPDIEVTDRKYPSLAYIDDRCIRFDGDFSRFEDDLRTFDVYWRNKKDRIFDAFFA
ncbi:MAG: hypothetical protein HGA16_02160 [Candidatus Moranbacteria bacterium]|nr:hypothetical protein [Candidatus Moranbacteria bacterium]